MKRDFIRSKRTSNDLFDQLVIKIEKRSTKSTNGIIQALINVVIYVLIFVIFFRENLQFMGIFIAFMVASILSQLIIRFGRAVKKTMKFPFFEIVKDKKLYQNYLAKIENEIDDCIDRYDKYLANNLYDSSQLDNIIENLNSPLFCRLPMHNDFLTINLGLTNLRYPIQIIYPSFSYNENDVLLDQFKNAITSKIENSSNNALPYSFSLREQRRVAFINNGLSPDEFIQIVNAIVLDVSTFQSSEEVTLCLAFNANWDLDWARLLPHIWFSNRRLIYCGSEPEAEFVKLLHEALINKSKHIVAVIDVDFAQNYLFYDVFNTENLPDNLSVIFFSHNATIPTRVIHHMSCFKSNDKFLGKYKDHRLLLNSLTAEESEELAKKLFNIRLIDNRTVYSNAIPERLTFFELFNVKNALSVPKASSDQNTNIQACFPVKVGLGNEREEIYIDLSNDGDGNHCLVTGTNGSGKSEFMLTYVLSACSKYSPDYMSFVTIDFKGGAMSSKISNLPHCLGEFTNSSSEISKREVTRIAELLESEVSYREKIMNDTGCANDLQKYHSLYAAGKVKIALPRLLIVVDEVAVFFAKDNTAAQYITHIATVGRSVGMILLLATQSKNGIIPSQVKTNINVNVEFYSEDDNKKGFEKIKGRAIINSHTKKDCYCQVALSAIYDSNLAVVDFITISAKSRMIRGNERYTQFEQMFNEIIRRYPHEKYSELINEVITEPLESCIKGRLDLRTLQDLYYGYSNYDNNSYPVGISDNIYLRKREAFCFTPSEYNLVVYGKPQSGKTTFIKSLLVSLCNKPYGLRPNAINVYIVAKNSSEYNNYFFPHIGGIYPDKDLYYFLLFLVNEINERSNKSDGSRFIPIVAIIDDCYTLIQQSEELTKMLKYVSNESVKYCITIILALPFKPGFGNAVLMNFNSFIAFHMGDDFEYSSLMHLDAIKQIPEFNGRCLTNIAGNANRTFETQIAFPYTNNEDEVLALVKNYSDLWSGKEIPKSIPLMSNVVSLNVDRKSRNVPIGLAKDLSECYWKLDIANTYLVSYFSDSDAITFTKYLINVFVLLNFDVIVVDTQRNSLKDVKNISGLSYYEFNEQDKLKNVLDSILDRQPKKDTILVMFEFVRCLFPSNIEEKELVKTLDSLIKNPTNKFFGLFADLKDLLNVYRFSGSHFGQYLEGINSGCLLGNTPNSHTFGFSGLSIIDQSKPLDIGWGVNVSPSSSEIKRFKIATEVEICE